MTELERLARRIAMRNEALQGILEVHRCNGRPEMTVGECIKADLCKCSCGLLIEPEGVVSASIEASQADGQASGDNA
jgi:hypothetical protein